MKSSLFWCLVATVAGLYTGLPPSRLDTLRPLQTQGTVCTVNSGMKKRKAEGERKGPPKITKNQGAGKAPFPAGSDSLDKLGTKDYWLAICPQLHISEQGKRPEKQAALLDEAARVREDLIEDGYSKIARRDAVASDSLVAKLHEGITSLVRAGWPATFILVFDECWEAIGNMQALMDAVTQGKNKCAYDIVAWHVDPSVGQAGFSPHSKNSGMSQTTCHLAPTAR